MHLHIEVQEALIEVQGLPKHPTCSIDNLVGIMCVPQKCILGEFS